MSTLLQRRWLLAGILVLVVLVVAALAVHEARYMRLLETGGTPSAAQASELQASRGQYDHDVKQARALLDAGTISDEGFAARLTVANLESTQRALQRSEDQSRSTSVPMRWKQYATHRSRAAAAVLRAVDAELAIARHTVATLPPTASLADVRTLLADPRHLTLVAEADEQWRLVTALIPKVRASVPAPFPGVGYALYGQLKVSRTGVEIARVSL